MAARWPRPGTEPRGLGLSLPGSPKASHFILVVVLIGSGASQCQTLSQDRNPAVQLEGKESKITLQLSMPMPEKVGRPFLFDICDRVEGVWPQHSFPIAQK